MYEVKIDVYQGPFDLLLKAIDEGKIDIYQVLISQITAAYFEYWKKSETSLVLASDFLFMAAYLLELKSKALLPQKEELLPGEDILGIEQSLVSHIQEYEMFKNLAKTLYQRKEIFERVYGRHEGEQQEKEIELVDVSLRDLVLAFKKVYEDAAKRESIVPIQAEEIKVSDRIQEIKAMLENCAEGVAFENIFILRTRAEIIVTFLAILELAKQRFIRIVQNRRFGGIMIMKNPEKEETNAEPAGPGEEYN